MKHARLFFAVALCFSLQNAAICQDISGNKNHHHMKEAQAPVKTMTDDHREDLAALSRLNEQFIKNFINQDTASHEKIIHKDFVCIQNSGMIMGRNEYMEDWAHDYGSGHFISFGYTEEFIRIFGNCALVRSRTVYTKHKDGAIISGQSVYTDTYIRENGKWLCVQAQITPVTYQAAH